MPLAGAISVPPRTVNQADAWPHWEAETSVLRFLLALLTAPIPTTPSLTLRELGPNFYPVETAILVSCFHSPRRGWCESRHLQRA